MLPASVVMLRVLRAGLAEVTATPTRWHSHMRDWPEDERDRWLARTIEKPPSIVQGYQRAEVKFPTWVVLLGQASDDRRALADSVGRTGLVQHLGGLQRTVVNVWLWSDSMDEINVHHALIYRLMKSRLQWLIKELGTEQVLFEGANDVLPDPEWMPGEVYVRTLSWAIVSMETAIYEDEGRGTDIHTWLDASVVQGYKGGVKP